MSLGGAIARGANTSAVDAAIDYALKNNVMIVNAAGNDGRDIVSNPYWPAKNGGKAGFLVVGATSAPRKTKASFSNYNPKLVHLAAPGASASSRAGIYTTKRNNNYGRAQGTSFSSPIVAGAASLAVALIKSRGDSYTNDKINSLLLESAQKISGLEKYVKDGNYLDVNALLQIANDQATPAIVDQSDDQHVVVDEPVKLKVETSVDEGLKYQWYKDGEVIPGATDQQFTVPSAKVDTAGSYYVEIIGPSGKKITSSDIGVTVYSRICQN